MMDTYFIVSHTYQNRKGRYTVLAIRGDTLTVRYEDGTLTGLNALIQKRIINNMSTSHDFSHSIAGEIHGREKTINPNIDWAPYDTWNQWIFKRYFNAETANRLVYLNISDEELAGLSTNKEAWPQPLHDFVNAVLSTLDFRRGYLLNPHFQRLHTWKNNGAVPPPPFIGVLALFCLVAQYMKTDETFHANNYYDRLAELLLRDTYTEKKRKDICVGYEHAQYLWHELEAWLITQGGRFGLPSALPMYGLSHVGYPISQALLRANDREKLSEFFMGVNLEPRQYIPPADMERLMAYWVPQSLLSAAAKTNWKNNSARRRMAEIASLELSVWDGTIPAHEAEYNEIHTTPLVLEVRICGGPKPHLQWDTLIRMPPKVTEITYEATSGTIGLPVDGHYERSIDIIQGFEEQWSKPIQISVADLLVTMVSMVAREKRSKIIWQPRKVIVLTWNDELKLYRSGQYLEFGCKSIVLAYRTIAQNVYSILSSADGGTMKQIPASWGIPEDWVMFSDVQLSGIPDIGGDTELEALLPIIWSSVNWEGGLALPGRRRWLASRLPTIRINSMEDIQSLAATVQLKSALSDMRDQPITISFKNSGNTLDIDLTNHRLTEGVYGLNVDSSRNNHSKIKKDITRQTFEIRSPDLPLNPFAASLCHWSGSSCWTISASPIDVIGTNEKRTRINGAFIQPECDISSPIHDFPIAVGTNISATQEDQIGSSPILRRTLEQMTNCFNGEHYWIIDPVNDLAGYYRDKNGVCHYCGLHQKFPAFHRNNFLSGQIPLQKQNSTLNESVQSSIPMMTHVNDNNTLDYDGLLDACFTLGKGSWSQFEFLARQVSNDPAFPYETLQLFSALGHLDIQLDPTYTHAAQWEIARPTIATTASNKAILTGYRSPQVLTAIEKLVKQKGGAVIPIPSSYGPTAYFIVGLNHTFLTDLATAISEDLQKKLSVSRRPDVSIAAQLDPLSTILSAQHTLVQPTASEVFDVSKMSWVSWDMSKPITYDGLYRSDSFPRIYFLKRREKYIRVSYRIGKHLAASFNNQSLIAYDPLTKQLECPLGGQLPGLYERAVVLSSGLPPTLNFKNSRVIYSEVTQEVASAIWATIYSNSKALE